MDRFPLNFIVLSIFSCLLNYTYCQEYRKWTPSQNDMEDLLCHEKCFSSVTNTFDEECCICNNNRNWTQVIEMHVEYTNIHGDNVLKLPGAFNSTTDTHYRVTHRHGYMISLPSNLCNFTNLVEIDFSYNAIEELISLQCLDNLDSFRLDYNKITYISNATFTNMSNLRVLSLTHNLISSMDIAVFHIGYGRNIMYVDMSYNSLLEVDTSNIMFRQFCEVNYNNLPLKTIVNRNHWQVESGIKYGTGGSVNFDNVNFKHFLNYSDLGLPSWSETYKAIDFSISINETQIPCDCHFGNLNLESVIKKLWKQYESYVCGTPKEYEGIKIGSFYKGPYSPDMLICNITKCPSICHCFTRSSRNVLVIDCTNAGLTKMPEPHFIPYGAGEPLELQFSGNSIPILSDAIYLGRVQYMNIANNSNLISISDAAIHSMPDTVRINATLNKLKNLPRGLQNKDPNLFYIGRHWMDCSCETTWVSDWINLKKFTENHSEYLCQNLDVGHLNMLDDLSYHLDCLLESYYYHYIIAGVLVFITIVIVPYSLIRKCCYPEVYVIYRKRIRKRQPPKRQYDYDVYVSFDEENELLRKWIHTLVGHFELKCYRIYVPCRDEPFGISVEKASKDAMMSSRNFLVVLSQEFVKEDTADESNTITKPRLEYDTSLNLYKKDKSRNLVLINFDNLDSTEVSYRYYKAFINVGETITFAERTGQLFSNIEKQISPPCLRLCVKGGSQHWVSVFIKRPLSSTDNDTQQTKTKSVTSHVTTDTPEVSSVTAVHSVRGHGNYRVCKCMSCEIKRTTNLSKTRYLEYDKRFSTNNKTSDNNTTRRF